MVKAILHWSTINNFKVNCCAHLNRWFAQQGECELCLSPAGNAGFLCDQCLQTLPHNTIACSQCAEPLSQPGRCRRCQQQPPAFDYAFCPFRYEAPFTLWLPLLKDQRQLRWLPRLSWLMQQQKPAFGKPDALVYIPSGRRKLLLRGFNPAGLLARTLSRNLKLPLLNRTLLRESSLDQRGLNRRQRQHNSQHSLQAGKHDLRGLHILLIEDVITTGATADAAARALKQQGAAIVGVWALARTPPKSS